MSFRAKRGSHSEFTEELLAAATTGQRSQRNTNTKCRGVCPHAPHRITLAFLLPRDQTGATLPIDPKKESCRSRTLRFTFPHETFTKQYFYYILMKAVVTGAWSLYDTLII